MGPVPREQGAPPGAAVGVGGGVDADDQLVLLPPAKARRRARSSAAKAPPPDAMTLPVARLLVDVSPPHLDRPFDYLVPEPMSGAAQPGVRVKVRFAGREVEALVLERLAATDHEGRLSRLSRVVSPVPVLTPQVAALVRAVADRWAGTAADVLRAAVPPRHARAENAVLAAEADALLARRPTGRWPPVRASLCTAGPGPWSAYRVVRPRGPLAAGRQGPVPRAVWTATCGQDWAGALAVLVSAARAGGRLRSRRACAISHPIPPPCRKRV
jgi:primosomal protein N' (replication factor Y)